MSVFVSSSRRTVDRSLPAEPAANRFPRLGKQSTVFFQGLENFRPIASKAWKRFPLRFAALLAIIFFRLPSSVFLTSAHAAEPNIIELPVKNPATHAILRNQLEATEPVLRAEALDALAHIGDPGDAAAVRARLHDPDARVRAEALRAMARRGETADDTDLARLAADADRIVRCTVFAHGPADFFRRRPDQVERGLNDAKPEVRVAAAAHVAALALAPEDAARRMLAESDSAARAAWLRSLAAAGGALRDAGLRAALTSSADRALVQTALEIVARGDAGFDDAVLSRARAERGAVAAAAIAAAARVRCAGASQVLGQRLETENDPALWPALCEALGVLDDETAVAALAAELQRRRGFAAQSAAVRALGGMKTLGASATLVAATRDPDPRVRTLAAETLGARREASAAAALWLMLDDGEAEVITAALQALHRLGTPRAGARPDRLRALTNHENPNVVAGAIRIRGDLGDRDMIPDLVQRLRRVRIDVPAEPRAAALDAMIALGHGAEVRRAIELVAKNVVPPSQYNPQPMPDSPSVRRAALRYLERFGDAAAAATMLAAFDELPPPDLRDDIARTATKLTGRPHRALPDYRYRSYDVESLQPPSHPSSPEKPGVVAES